MISSIGVSFATASKLRLVNFKFEEPLPTLYFLIGKRCIYDCKYCTHARNSKANVLKLSRVTWPEFPIDVVVEKLEKFLENSDKEVRRICFQVISDKDYEKKLSKAIGLFRKFDIPISISVRSRNLEEVRNYFKLGIERIGMAVDAVTKELFEDIRGGSWEKYMELIRKTALYFPNRISTHLIIGLGETEKQAVDFMFEMKRLGIRTALFAFTPIKGTKFENHLRPSLESYRKIQLARFLIYEKDIKKDQIIFENNTIKRFKTDFSSDLRVAFLTSGCDFCNRPFYNESPNGAMYNVPYKKLLEKMEISNFSNLFRR